MGLTFFSCDTIDALFSISAEGVFMKPDLSIVVPAYNEEESLPTLQSAIESYLTQTDIHLQFVFVDDGSADNTYSMLCDLSFSGAQVKVVKLSKNYGAHSAIRAGVKFSDADKVMIYSSDMPEPIEDITLFYEELNSGYEIVYSERIGYDGGFGSRMFNKMINKHIEESYPSNGLIGVAFGAKVKAELNRAIDANSSIFFQIFRMGFSKKAIPIQYNEREHGESKWTLGKKIALFIDSFVSFSYTPIRVISMVGMLFSVVGLVVALLIVLFKLFNIVDFAAGWPTMISLLLFGFGITNVSLGIIAEYLIRTLKAVQRVPAFVVDEIVGEDHAQ